MANFSVNHFYSIQNVIVLEFYECPFAYHTFFTNVAFWTDLVQWTEKQVK